MEDGLVAEQENGYSGLGAKISIYPWLVDNTKKIKDYVHPYVLREQIGAGIMTVDYANKSTYSRKFAAEFTNEYYLEECYIIVTLRLDGDYDQSIRVKAGENFIW